MTPAHPHATPELLSSYLDRELAAVEAQRVEEHLASCGLCRDRYAGLEGVVTRLRRLEMPALPASLDQAVARRIALEGERQGLLDRFEHALGRVPRPPPTLALFAVVISLAAILYLFTVAVENASRTEVRIVYPAPPVEATAAAGSLELAGRSFERQGELWVERGVDPERVARELPWGSVEADALLATEPALGELRDRGDSVVLEAAGEVVLLHPGGAPEPGRQGN